MGKYQNIFDKLIINENKDDNVLIIDGTNAFIRSFSCNPALNEQGQHIGGLYGLLLSIGSNIRMFNATRCILVFDGRGGSQRRKKLYPEYKAQRATNKQRMNRMEHFKSKEEEIESMKWQFSRLYQYLETLPLTILCLDNIEADDVIAYITKQYFEKKSNSITIVSTDRDFYQLVDDRITVYSPTKKIMYDSKKLQEEFEFHPNNYLLYRMLTGDASDNITGIKGIGLKTFNKLFETENEMTLQEFKEIVKDKVKNDFKVPKVLTEIYKKMDNILDRNYKLMQLEETDISGHSKMAIIEGVEKEIPQLNRGKFRRLCLEDELHYNFKNVDDWLNRTFNTLNSYGS